MPMIALRSRRSLAFLAGGLILASGLAAYGYSTPAAHAESSHVNLTIDPATGPLSDLVFNDVSGSVPGQGDYTTAIDGLTCPGDYRYAGFLIPGVMSEAPTFEPNTFLQLGLTAPVGGFDTPTFQTVDGVIDISSAFPGTVWQTPDLPAGPIGRAFTEDGTWTIGMACTDSRSRMLLDENSRMIAAWATLTVSGSTWTVSIEGGSDPQTAADTSVATSAVLNSDGKRADLSATVSKAGTTAAATDASGSVQFFEGTTAVGEPVATADGVATMTTPNLSIGEHQFTAVYTPDTAGAALYNVSPASAPSQTVTVSDGPVTKVDTTLELTGATEGADGAKLTATVKAAGATATDAAGKVEFYEGDSKKAEADVAAGVATATVTGLAAGDHSFTAKYVPAANANFNASEAAAVVVTIVEPEPETLADNGTVKPGTKYAVAAPAGTFTDGDTVKGEIHSDPITLTETATAAADGSASYTFVAPSVLKAGDAHELVLTGDPSGKTYSLHFTVAGETPDGNGDGNNTTTSTGQNDPASFATDWVANAASSPAGMAGLFGIVLAFAGLAGSAWFLISRRRQHGQRG